MRKGSHHEEKVITLKIIKNRKFMKIISISKTRKRKARSSSSHQSLYSHKNMLEIDGRGDWMAMVRDETIEDVGTISERSQREEEAVNSNLKDFYKV